MSANPLTPKEKSLARLVVDHKARKVEMSSQQAMESFASFPKPRHDSVCPGQASPYL